MMRQRTYESAVAGATSVLVEGEGSVAAETDVSALSA